MKPLTSEEAEVASISYITCIILHKPAYAFQIHNLAPTFRHERLDIGNDPSSLRTSIKQTIIAVDVFYMLDDRNHIKRFLSPH